MSGETLQGRSEPERGASWRKALALDRVESGPKLPKHGGVDVGRVRLVDRVGPSPRYCLGDGAAFDEGE